MASFGFAIRFCPTDEELITYYLKNMIKNQALPFGCDSVMIRRDIYGEEGTPWILFGGDVPWQTPVDPLGKIFLDQKVVYVFSRLSGKHNGDRNKNRVAGCGQWHGNTAPERIKKAGTGELIGKKRAFTFTSKEETQGQWTMYEYYIDGDCLEGQNNGLDTSLVLCRIKRDDSKSSKGGKLVSRKSSRYGAVESNDQSGSIPALITDSEGATEATKRQLEIDQIGSSKKLRISTTDSSNVQELVALSDTSINSSNCAVNVVSGSGSVVDDTLGDIGYVPSCGDDAVSVEAYPDVCFDPGELLIFLENSPPDNGQQLDDGFHQTTSDGLQQIGGGSMIDQMQSGVVLHPQRVDDAFGIGEEFPDFNPNLALGDDIYSIPPDYDMDSTWEQYYFNPNSFFDFDPAAPAVHQSVENAS